MNNTQNRHPAIKAAVRDIYIVSALTLVNSVLAVSGSSMSFLLSLFFPYLAAVRCDTGFMGLSGIPCFIMFSLLPTSIFAVLGFLSSKGNVTAVRAAAAVTAADLLYTVVFAARHSAFSSLLISMPFHIFILIPLAGASLRSSDDSVPGIAGAEDGDPEMYKINESYSPVRFPRDADGDDGIIRFDAGYAKANGSLRTPSIVLTILGYVVIASGSFIASATLWDRTDNGLFFSLGLLMVAVLTALFIYRMIRLSPYIEQKMTVYYENDAGILCADKPDIPPFDHIEFDDLSILEEHPDHWKVSYRTQSGKTRKTVIPRSYPGLDDLVMKLSQ